MIIDDVNREHLDTQFKAIYDRKEEARLISATNTEAMKGLAEVLKVEKKVIALAYKTWAEQFKEKPIDLDQVSTIVTALE